MKVENGIVIPQRLFRISNVLIERGEQRMNRISILAGIGTAIILTGATLAALRAEPQAEAKPTTSSAWQYRVLLLTDVVDARTALKDGPGKLATAIESKFDELGNEGWEYAGEINGGMIFKRRKP